MIQDEQRRWRATAARPTMSIREEPHQGDSIRRFGLRRIADQLQALAVQFVLAGDAGEVVGPIQEIQESLPLIQPVIRVCRVREGPLG